MNLSRHVQTSKILDPICVQFLGYPNRVEMCKRSKGCWPALLGLLCQVYLNLQSGLSWTLIENYSYIIMMCSILFYVCCTKNKPWRESILCNHFLCMHALMHSLPGMITLSMYRFFDMLPIHTHIWNMQNIMITPTNYETSH